MSKKWIWHEMVCFHQVHLVLDNCMVRTCVLMWERDGGSTKAEIRKELVRMRLMLRTIFFVFEALTNSVDASIAVALPSQRSDTARRRSYPASHLHTIARTGGSPG